MSEDADAALRADVRAGLRASPKQIPCKHLYDARGSELFERICATPDYYPTRTELAIMDAHGAEMAEAIGPGCLVIEYGSGSSTKTERLLARLAEPAGYVPVEIEPTALEEAAARIRERFPGLRVEPLCADYTEPLAVPEVAARRRLAYFPGSTVGNFDPGEAEGFLRAIADTCGPVGALLIGVDLVKDRAVLERAYDDRDGVTAAFNRNLLTRLKRELGAELDEGAFEHRVIYNDEKQRVEMHLVSTRPQTVRVGGEAFSFEAGESIHTESSHKFTLDGFRRIADRAGFTVEGVWTDPEQLFSVQLLERAHGAASAAGEQG